MQGSSTSRLDGGEIGVSLLGSDCQAVAAPPGIALAGSRLWTFCFLSRGFDAVLRMLQGCAGDLIGQQLHMQCRFRRLLLTCNQGYTCQGVAAFSATQLTSVVHSGVCDRGVRRSDQSTIMRMAMMGVVGLFAAPFYGRRTAARKRH